MTRAKVCGKWMEAPEGDYYVVCGFDENHVVLRSRMPYHILKCLEQNPNHNKKQCPYDATEYIDLENYLEHITTCEFMRDVNGDSNEIERLRASGDMQRLKPTPYHFDLPECDEDWGECDNGDRRIGGIGRGRKMPQEQPVKKGLGRGELLRLCRERAARLSSQSSSSSSQSVQGQFDD